MNPQLAVNLKHHPITGISLIEASAGTGKTYTITHLYVRCLLETDYKVKQLLVVTFTNAATQELKGRIRELIFDVWNYLSNLDIKNSQFDELFSSYRQNTKAIFSLQEALINFDEAAIYSIHGFSQRVLNIFPVETNSLLQQHIIPDEKELEKSAIRDFWRKSFVNTDIETLQWILDQWNHPDNLLNDVRPLLAFEDTVQQVKEKLETDQLTKKINLKWNSLCLLWSNDHDKISNFLLQSNALNRKMVQLPTVKKLLEALKLLFSNTIPYQLPQKWPLITRTKLNSCLKKNMTDENIQLKLFEEAEELSQLHHRWVKSKKLDILISATNSVHNSVNDNKTNAQNISFNDLIKQLSEVIIPENISFINKVINLYPLAMVDEFQDTDNNQYHIFKTLYQSASELNSTLILIGDPKQAIYSFRGADVFTYQKAKLTTDKHYTLETNYRSTSDYISLVNELFSRNENAFIFDQLIEFSSSKANLKSPKFITENKQSAAPLVSWIQPYTEKPVSKSQATEFFADQCTNEISLLLKNKSILLDGNPVTARDLTILVKTGRQASLMKNKLAAQGISSALILRDSVFATDQAREISLLLEVLIEPSNIRRLCGLLSTDLFAWNAKQIFQLQQDNEQLILLLEQFKEYQSQWLKKGILSMFFKLMEDQHTLQKSMSGMDGERQLTNWIHIVELLQQQSSRQASFSQVLHWLIQQREQATDATNNEEHQLRLESDSNLVRIVTIHKSKGLQYPIVFMPFMWDVKSSKNQPHSYSYHDATGNKKVMILSEEERDRWHQENLAEEIRLFYVAITRAIYRCYLGWGNIKGAGSSAIAHCLFNDKIKNEKYPQDILISQEAELVQPFKALNQNTENITLCLIKDINQEINQKSIDEDKAETIILSAKIFQRKIKQQWGISSYSQIATTGFSEVTDRPDYDAVKVKEIQNEIPVDIEILDRFNFFKGAKAGNFLHDLLEHQPFDQPVNTKLFLQKCNEYGFDNKWLPCLEQWIAEVLSSDLGGFQLRQLKSNNKICEMEFYMSSKNLHAESLNTLLHQYGYSRADQSFAFSTINGFLKGFIDLVFEVKGQYFIADYKSNFLGHSYADYDQYCCNEAMHDHHYHLQYLLYSLALHRFLKQRIKKYNYNKHFGGVYYLFLRGMSTTTRNGIYFHKPEQKIIQQLDDLFNE